jgi:hypothetical protein
MQQAIARDLEFTGIVIGPEVQAVVDSIVRDVFSLEKENISLRREVNALRAKLGMGRKYVEWDETKPMGDCPASGG